VVLGAAALLVAVVHRLGGRRLVGPVAVATCVASVGTVPLTAPSADWRVIVCDVGQGTAVIARTSVGSLLLDAGPAGGDVAGCLARAGVDDLAGVVVSHFHVDHVAGLPEVLVSRQTAGVVAPAAAAQSTTRTAVVDLVQGAGVSLTTAAAGQHWQWGDVTARVLWPPGDQRSAESEANNGSLVLLLEWSDGFRALIPGDIEPESQQAIMDRWTLGALDVAVIPHHGSDHQDPRFAGWTRPGVAIASAGVGNSYGHPAPTTLAEYAATGAVVRRTDQAGAVVVSVTVGHSEVTDWG
jgi:competence protein ComEC